MVDREYRHVTRKTASSRRSWELGHNATRPPPDFAMTCGETLPKADKGTLIFEALKDDKIRLTHNSYTTALCF